MYCTPFVIFPLSVFDKNIACGDFVLHNSFDITFYDEVTIQMQILHASV